MNILRKAMAAEAERLKPLLGRAYHAILKYQEARTPANEARLREAMEPTVAQLMVFRPYMPAYKQEYFNLLEAEWRNMRPGDLIMLFDHCVNIMHLRLERLRSENEAQQPWTKELLELLDRRRAAGPGAPANLAGGAADAAGEAGASQAGDAVDAAGPGEVRAASPAGSSAGEFLCSGVAASPGTVVGPARVVLVEADLTALQPGEILVCKMSTPDWVTHFSMVRALVTDQGGVVSHAAIIAREFGIPCVVGCQNATTAIHAGDVIEVNGDTGIVMRG